MGYSSNLNVIMSISARYRYGVSVLSVGLAGTAAFALQAPPPVPAPPPAAQSTPFWTPPPPSNTAAGTLAGAPPAGLPAPKIQFDSPAYDFGKVMSGQPVNHTYYFTNTGSQDLVLNNVQGTCGCTVVTDWARQVKPGASGHISVVFNTANYNTPITKLVTVTCNDRSRPGGVFSLQLKGVVWRPIEAIPPTAALALRPDVPFTSVTIRITNRLDEALILSPPESSNPLLGAELRTNMFGRDYRVVISNTAALPPGTVQGRITLKTSAANLPVITITAWANSQPPVNVVPARIDLRQAPLATNQLAYLTIINNSTNPITLAEPSVAVPGLDVKVIALKLGLPAPTPVPAGQASGPVVEVTTRETQPGHYFSLLLKFPAGFELPAGQPGTFTLKTTHPRMPLIKVPIYQALRSTKLPVVLHRPAPPIPRPAASAPRPPQPAARPASPPPFPPAPTGTASSTSPPSPGGADAK